MRIDLKVLLEKVTDREVGGGLAIGDRAAFTDEPAMGVMGADELVEQAGLAHPRLPDHGDYLAVAVAGVLHGLAQGLQLRLGAPRRG